MIPEATIEGSENTGVKRVDARERKRRIIKGEEGRTLLYSHLSITSWFDIQCESKNNRFQKIFTIVDTFAIVLFSKNNFIG